MSRVTCQLCDLVLTHAFVLTRHTTGRRCKERQLAKTLFANGLHPVEFRWQAKSDHAAEALRAFGLDVELHPTRGRRNPQGEGTSAGNEAWTSEEGVSLALTIEYIAHLLGLSYPEAARRLNDHRELIGPFGTAWRLGSKDDDMTLIEILLPINYVLGSDGKKRWRKPVKLRPESKVLDWEWA